MYTMGDDRYWTEIETSSGEFDKTEDAYIKFQNEFLRDGFEAELCKRCIFIEDGNGRKVATAMAWNRGKDGKHYARLHWIAVHADYQGLGLGKAVISEAVRLLIELEGDVDIYLSTQTWSYKAISIYQKFGFAISDKKGLMGYKNDESDKARLILKELGIDV
jgi:ribosomal protein S18 acetylase RimI-like enzyme